MDREKVMSWLEGLAQQDWRMFHSDSEVQVIAESALALLKEQEPVKPYFVNTNYEQHWKCGNCDWVIGTQYNFCPKCGKPVKWK